MDTELKFRAYNKFFKEMYYFDFTQNIEVGVNGLWVKHENGSICINQPSIKVMQYTGLKDNKRTNEYPNGQEIYKDDIVSLNGCRFGTARIEFFDGRFELRINNSDVSWRLTSDLIRGHDIKVIGNIHENLELSKGV